MWTFVTKRLENLLDGDIIVQSTGDGKKFYAVDVPFTVMGIRTGEIWVTEVTYDSEGTWNPCGESEPIPVIHPEYYALCVG